MASRTIDIRLGSSFDPKGVVAAETQIQILEKTVKGFGRGIGGVMGSVSRIIGDLFTGGLWSAGSRALGFIIAKFYEWRDSAKEAAEAASKAAKETADAIKSSVSEISSTMSSGISSVDKYTSSLIKQLDATKQLAVAEKELEKQRAIASGDSAAAARADEV